MMLQIVSLVLALELLHSSSAAYTFDASGKASFCKDNDCALFTTTFMNQNQNEVRRYEVRRYEASKWVETEINMPMETAKRTLFWRLFRYIQGQNTNNQKINMTVPVLGKHSKSSNSYKMMFYISNSVPNPPQPTDPTVTIRSVPAFTAYVRTFPGYPRTKQEWEAEEILLTNSLNAAGVSFDQSNFITAGYDAPWVQERHNEVWLLPA